MQEIIPGKIYRHFKGKMYQVLCVAMHTETEELLVIYQALYGERRMFARPYAMFAGEVDRDKYPGVKQKYRFQQID